MVWTNGEIPESDLVIFRRGWNRVDGDWFWGLTPATYARHLALLRRAYARTGRWLSPSEGWSCYRPYAAQVIARRMYGNGAAVPRTSSHGGFWEGQETLAIDYGNWAWVYENHGGRAAFYEDCRAVGLTPGMIQPDRNYPDEPWHVIDKGPRGPVPAFADDPQPIPIIQKEWFEMPLDDQAKADIKQLMRDVLSERGMYGDYQIIPLAEGGIWLLNANTRKRVHIGSEYHVELLRRYFNNNGDKDAMNAREVDIVLNDYIGKVA